MKKTLKAIFIPIGCIALVILAINLLSMFKDNEIEAFRKIKSEDEYELIFSGYRENGYNEAAEIAKRIFTFPASVLADSVVYSPRYYKGGGYYETNSVRTAVVEEAAYDMVNTMGSLKSAPQEAEMIAGSTNDEYSKTNVQVENVDEGDSQKTDGKYIYTINNERVYIVDTQIATSLKNVKTIESDMYPEDLLLGANKLVVIGRTKNKYTASTEVKVYDKDNNFEEIKSITIEGEYETSRMIEDRVIVVTDMYEYYEDKPIYRIDNNDPIEVKYSNIFYNEKYRDYGMTYILSLNLSKLDKEDGINVYGTSMKADSVYASENNLYLIKNYYGMVGNEDSDSGVNIGCLFTYKGVFGLLDYENDYNYNNLTKIVKLSFDKNNEINVKAHKVLTGRTINQFSFDEKDGNLRLALSDANDGDVMNASSVVVLDSNLKEIGRLSGIAEGEDIYATRFIGDRLYLVTYLNTDPLFVIDMSSTKPKMLGELEISGYSRYLHPYDEDHIIGIGVETESHVDYDAFGRVINEYDTTKGLKMAMFDVSDVANPKEISKIVIGDEKTTSDILENHKSLLFSKEKGIIAIPVTQRTYLYYDNNLSFSGKVINDDVTNNGFALYNVSVEDGLSLKGYIYHENIDRTNWYRYNASQVRGMYIKDYLFTISNDYIKVNGLNTLKEISKYIFEK